MWGEATNPIEQRADAGRVSVARASLLPEHQGADPGAPVFSSAGPRLTPVGPGDMQRLALWAACMDGSGLDARARGRVCVLGRVAWRRGGGCVEPM